MDRVILTRAQRHVLEEEDWLTFYNLTLLKYQNMLEVIKHDNIDDIHVVTLEEYMTAISDEIRSFLNDNAIESNDIKTKSGRALCLQRHFHEDIRLLEEGLKKKRIKVTFIEPENEVAVIRISGTSAGLQMVKQRIEDITENIKENKIKLVEMEPGRYFNSKKGPQYIKELEIRHKAVIEMRNESIGSKAMVERIHADINGIKIRVLRGDLTKHVVDAVVNPANELLKHEGGLSRALLDKGGDAVRVASEDIITRKKKLKVGEVVKTTAGKLPCRFLLHTVGPIWEDGVENEVVKLHDTIINCLEMATQLGLQSVAIPAVSSGIYKFPIKLCTQTIVKACREFCLGATTLTEIHLADTRERVVKGFAKYIFASDKDLDEDGIVASGRFERPALDEELTREGLERDRSHSEPSIFPALAAPHLAQPLPKGDYYILDDQTLQTKEEVQVSLRKGSIVNARVDVMVCTGSPNMVYGFSSGGVAKAISEAAGPNLEKECRAFKEEIKYGEIKVTDGYNLPCKEVYHGVIRSWKNPAESERDIRNFIKACIKTATEKGRKSMAFPLIGAGQNNVPKEECARIFYNEISLISESFAGNCIKDIRIVIYEKDLENLEAFENEIRERGHHSLPEPILFQQEEPETYAEDRDSHGGVSGFKAYEPIVMKNISVQIGTGNLVDESLDAIINSTNTTLDLGKGAVSINLSEKGGQLFVDACQAVAPQLQDGGVVITTGGDLTAGKVIHLVAPTAGENMRQEWQNVMLKALNEADKDQVSSIGFPALGTGIRGLKPNIMADITSKVLALFDADNPKNLKLVKIVLYDDNLLDTYKIYLSRLRSEKKRDRLIGRTRSFALSITPSIHSRVSLCGTGATSAAPALLSEEESDSLSQQLFMQQQALADEEYSSIDSLPSLTLDVQPCILTVFSKTDAAARDIKRDIDKKCEPHVSTLDDAGTKDFVARISDDKKAELIIWGRKLYTELTFSKKDGTITLRGLPDDVKELETQVIKFKSEYLNSIREMEEMAQNVKWYSCPPNSLRLEMYSAGLNQRLEKAYQSGEPEVTFNAATETCVIKLGTEMKEFPSNCEVVRREKDDQFFPDTWRDLENEDQTFYKKELVNGSSEFNIVKDGVQKTHLNTMKKILKIERIQNKALFRHYMSKKEEITGHNRDMKTEEPMERTLYHGTKQATIDNINSNGFDRGHCSSSSDNRYGQGVNYARNFCYSASDDYAERNDQGQKFVYQCRVLTGIFTAGKKGMKVAPDRVGTIKYDSVVDKMDDPGIFVIFNDYQAYPDYLITFE